jgi:Zn ribbon nucleic-acid-binding protein
VNTPLEDPFARIRNALSQLVPGEDRFIARAARLGCEACDELEAEVERLREERDRLAAVAEAARALVAWWLENDVPTREVAALQEALSSLPDREDA